MTEYLDEIPEIEEFCGLTCAFMRIVKDGTLSSHNGYAVTDGFFDMFPKKPLAGDISSLKHEGNALITESMAVSMFGSIEGAMGQTLDIDIVDRETESEFTLSVSGIIDDYTNEIFDADVIVSLDTQVGKAVAAFQVSSLDQTFVRTSGNITQAEL
jgi:hypothetical protein